MTYELFPKCTFSQESAASPSPRSGRNGRRNGRSSREVPPASQPPLLELSEGKPTHVISGRKWLGLLTKDDLISSCTRILLERPSWRSTEFLLTWKASGTGSGHTLFRLAPSTPRTDGTGFGLWPTPRSNKWGPPDSHGNTAMWPTPSGQLHNDSESPESFRKRQAELKDKGINGNGAGTPLPIVAKETAMWSTPRASDGEKGGKGMKFKSGSTKPLPSQAATTAALRATPISLTPAKDGNSEAGNSVGLVAIREQIGHWATPTSEKGLYNRKGASETSGDGLATQAIGTAQNGSAERTESGGALNPEFVCWLMGYPKGWLNLEPLEMPLFGGPPRK